MFLTARVSGGNKFDVNGDQIVRGVINPVLRVIIDWLAALRTTTVIYRI